ncbi:MAG: wax ester/triacylglycerol synthase family O-acyltransferase [Polyangiales bacterium]
MTAYSDRLSALDASFLDVESETAPMHMACVLVFEGEALLDEHGALPMARLRRYIDHALDGCERYRQRLDYVPGLRQPVWVDDERFDLDFHLRTASVPAPGTDRELKALAGTLLSQQIDRSRPLWEMYLVDGLSDKRVAMVIKAHHCMVDGVGGMQLLMALLRPYRDTKVPRGNSSWSPRPAPSGLGMLRHELRERVSGVWSAVKTGLPGWRTDTTFTSDDVGPQRRLEWTTVDLDGVKEIKTSLGGTVNDVVLAIVAGAARRYLKRQGIDPEAVDPLRAILPVHTGGPERLRTGNQVAMVMAKLPVDEPSPRDRLHQVVEDTSELKHDSHQAEGAKLVEDIADVATQKLLSGAFKLAMNARAFDMIVTNVKGPSFPLYLLDARLTCVYPVVPLMPKQNLGIALFSYEGRIHWGFNSDWECFSAVDDFVSDLQASFEELMRTLPEAREQAAGVVG